MARWSDLDQLMGAMELFRNLVNNRLNEVDQPYAAGQARIAGSTYPRTNLSDTGDNLEVIAEVPGLAKEDLNVKIQGNYLEISGARTTDAPEGYTTHRTERGTASFSRSFTLPYDVDAGKVEATLRDGLLLMKLPKSEAAKPRQIAIN